MNRNEERIKHNGYNNVVYLKQNNVDNYNNENDMNGNDNNN